MKQPERDPVCLRHDHVITASRWSATSRRTAATSRRLAYLPGSYVPVRKRVAPLRSSQSDLATRPARSQQVGFLDRGRAQSRPLISVTRVWAKTRARFSETRGMNAGTF